MRIQQITVRKLFGKFDYEIPIKLEDRLRIIYGLNGTGKTTILRIVNEIFNGNYSLIYLVPFESFKIDFDDNTHLLVKGELDIAKINNGKCKIIFKSSKGGKNFEISPQESKQKRDFYMGWNLIQNLIQLVSIVEPDPDPIMKRFKGIFCVPSVSPSKIKKSKIFLTFLRKICYRYPSKNEVLLNGKIFRGTKKESNLLEILRAN